MYPQHAIREVVARVFYNRKRGQGTEWVADARVPIPDSELAEEAQELAEAVIEALDTGPHQISRSKLANMDAIMLAMLDFGGPITRADGRRLTASTKMNGRNYDYAIASLLRNQLATFEPIESRPEGSAQRISLTQRGYQKALQLAGLQKRPPAA